MLARLGTRGTANDSLKDRDDEPLDHENISVMNKPAAIGYDPADYLTNRPATGSPALPVLGLVALIAGGMFLSGAMFVAYFFILSGEGDPATAGWVGVGGSGAIWLLGAALGAAGLRGRRRVLSTIALVANPVAMILTGVIVAGLLATGNL